MLELVTTSAGVVVCHAAPGRLDAMEFDGTFPMRIAPDELFLVCEPDASAAVQRDASARLDGAGALVLDASDGWAVRTLVGSLAGSAFARLSALPPPGRGWVQGAVLGLPAKVAAPAPDRIDVFVASMFEGFLATKLRERCADLIAAERASTWETGP